MFRYLRVNVLAAQDVCGIRSRQQACEIKNLDTRKSPTILHIHKSLEMISFIISEVPP